MRCDDGTKAVIRRIEPIGGLNADVKSVCKTTMSRENDNRQINVGYVLSEIGLAKVQYSPPSAVSRTRAAKFASIRVCRQ